MSQQIDQAANARGTSASNQTSDLPQESTGIITSDSLAAESLSRDGSFAGGAATASQVPSRATTANTTDTSGASILPAARDAAQRAPGPDDYTTPSLSAFSGSGAYDTTKGGPQAADGGAAPAYVGSVTRGFQGEQSLRPKGNVTQGGFDGDAPNASFTAEIGGRNDPGRVGLEGVQKANARSGLDAGYEGANAGGRVAGDKGGFEVLREEGA